MRKSLMVPIGLVSAAVLAVAGIAAANAANASPSEPPATAAVPATAATNGGTATAIGQAVAEQAALAAVPDSSVLETRLRSDNARLVWNVHLSAPGGVVEVRVDAQTGAVALDDDDARAGAGATVTVPDADQADDHSGDRGPGGSGPDDNGHRDGHGADDPAGHH
jgi:uncharacterized membrane protein YkoI